jgi:hypothetical protein
VRRRFVRLLMRRPGENAAARYQRQYRDANQRKRDIRKRHGVPPSMHRLFQTSHAFRHFAARVDYWIRSLSGSAGIVAEVYMGSKATKHRDCRRQHRQPNNRWQRARERISASNFGWCRYRERACHENDLRGYGSCLRIRDRHGRHHDHCADRVMRDLLMFLGRGFALFPGGPAVIFHYPALSRGAVVVEARKCAGGPSE